MVPWAGLFPTQRAEAHPPAGGGQPTLPGPIAFSNLPLPTSLASSPHSRRLCPSRDIRLPRPRLRTRRIPSLQVPPCFPDVGPIPIPSAPGAPGHSSQWSLLGWGCLGTIYSRGVNSQEQGGGIPKAGPGTPLHTTPSGTSYTHKGLGTCRVAGIMASIEQSGQKKKKKML